MLALDHVEKNAPQAADAEAQGQEAARCHAKGADSDADSKEPEHAQNSSQKEH
jgi:hypothetical protein